MAQQAQGADWEKLAELSLADGDHVQSKPPSGQQESKPAVAGDEGMDMAIKAALQGPERSIVLKIEEQVEAFVRDQSQDVLEFPSNFSNYQRMLAHKVAQHYKLQTSTVGYEAGQGRVVAKRTTWAAVPQVKLANLDAKAFKGPMPGAKALVKRPNSGELSGRGAGQASNEQAAAATKTHKEREDEYNAARERIIGKQGQQPQQSGQAQQQNAQQQGSTQQQGGQPQQGGSSSIDGGYSSGGSSSSALASSGSAGRGNNGSGSGDRGRGFANMANAGRGAANGRGRGGAAAATAAAAAPAGAVGSQAAAGGAAAGAGGGGGGAGRGGKAVYRDRDRDVQDPDYRRGVSRYQPRFDPGYGPQLQGNMYAMPTYGSEFPAMHSQGAPGAPGTAYPGAVPMPAMYGPYPVAVPSFRPPPPPPPGTAPGGSPHTGAAGDGGVTGYASGQPVPMGSMAMQMGGRPYGTIMTPVPMQAMQAMQMGYPGLPHGAIPAHAGGPGGGHPTMYGTAHPGMHMAHMVPAASYGYMQAQMGEGGTMMAMTPQGPVPVYAAGGYPAMHAFQPTFPPTHMQQQQLPRAGSGNAAAAGGGDGERGGSHHQSHGSGGHGQQQSGRGGGYSSSGSQQEGSGGRSGNNSSGSGTNGAGKKEHKGTQQQQ